jgi:hypothetical protein
MFVIYKPRRVRRTGPIGKRTNYLRLAPLFFHQGPQSHSKECHSFMALWKTMQQSRKTYIFMHIHLYTYTYIYVHNPKNAIHSWHCEKPYNNGEKHTLLHCRIKYTHVAVVCMHFLITSLQKLKSNRCIKPITQGSGFNRLLNVTVRYVCMYILWKWWQGWAQVITFIWSKQFWVQNNTEE